MSEVPFFPTDHSAASRSRETSWPTNVTAGAEPVPSSRRWRVASRSSVVDRLWSRSWKTWTDLACQSAPNTIAETKTKAADTSSTSKVRVKAMVFLRRSEPTTEVGSHSVATAQNGTRGSGSGKVPIVAAVRRSGANSSMRRTGIGNYFACERERRRSSRKITIPAVPFTTRGSRRPRRGRPVIGSGSCGRRYG